MGNYWTGEGDNDFRHHLEGSRLNLTTGILFIPTVHPHPPPNSLTESIADAFARFPSHAPQHGQPVGLHRDCLIVGFLWHLLVRQEKEVRLCVWWAVCSVFSAIHEMTSYTSGPWTHHVCAWFQCRSEESTWCPGTGGMYGCVCHGTSTQQLYKSNRCS